MKARITLAICTALASIAALAGCSAPAEEADSGAKSVYIISCTDTIPWCAKYNSQLEARFTEAGMEVNVLTDVFDAAVQNQHMNQAITAKPDAIVLLASDPSGIIPAVNRAKAAGIAVVNTDAPLAGEAGIAFEVVADHYAIGRFAAESIVEGLKAEGLDKGNILIGAGPMASYTTVQRLAGFESVLKGNPQYEIVSVQDTGFDQNKAVQLASQVFAQYQAQGGIQAAYGMNDLVALGIVKAAQQAGLKVGADNNGLIVSGGNCLAPGVPAIRSGELYSSATQTPGPEADQVAAATIAYLNGEEQPKQAVIEEFKITKDNIEQYAGECTF